MFFNKVLNKIYQYYQMKRVEWKFIFLRNSSQKIKEVTTALRHDYKEYVKQITTLDMAISLKTAVFLRIFCEGFKPKRILDLGSGFSSFVLRSYAATQNGVEVWTVDDSPEWLERTRVYLTLHNLSTTKLILWNKFQEGLFDPFDLILYDIGNMTLRCNSLHFVLKLIKKRRGVVILDDMHKAPFRKYVSDTLNRCSCSHSDLSMYTRDELGRYCWIVFDICGTNNL